MAKIPCIELHFPELAPRRDALIKEGFSPKEASIKAAIEEHQRLFTKLNEFKKGIGVAQEKYVPFDNSKEVKEINDRYNTLIEDKKKGSEGELPVVTEEKPNEKTDAEQNKKDEIPNTEKKGDTTNEPPNKISETTEGGEEQVTGVKKAITEDIRGELNLPKVEFPKMGVDAVELNSAKERIDSGKVVPTDMVDRILNEKTGYKNEQEVFDMQYYAHQLKTKYDTLTSDITSAKNENDKAEILGKKQQISDLLDRQTEAAQLAGNKWGKIGNSMQPVIDMGFNIFRQKSDIKEAYGGEIPKDVKERIDKITAERDAAIEEKNKIEEQLKQRMAKEGFEKVRKESALDKNKADREKLKKEADDLIEQIKKEFNGGNDPSAPVRSGIGLTDKMVVLVGKLALNYLKQGANGLEPIIDKVYEGLKDTISGITKKDIREAIANYEPFVATKDTERLNKKADLLENKVTPPSVKTKGNKFEPSEPTDFNKPSKAQVVFRNNNEWVKANQRVAEAEFKIKIEKRKAMESDKNMYQKGLAWAGRLTRLSVLSGYHVLGKLASAAVVGAAAKRPFEQIVGGIYSKIFSDIASKAPIEGSIFIKSELKWYKEFFDPKKFATNSWEILKSGSSLLGKRLGSAEYEHVPGLYLPTDLHQIIKDPVKRATFEASFRNYMIWANKNGLDVTDQLVINTMENASYKRAQYEIFQEQNSLSKKFTSFKSNLEKQGNAGATAKFLVDFMIPVSTVPLNIVRRVVTTSPIGLIRGGKEVVQAYRKGIEKLTNDEAEHVMMQLKQGTLGTALWMLGWYGAASFGGLYSKYNPNKQRKEGELASDEMEVGGKMLPKPMQHALPLEVIQFSATARHVFDNYVENKNATNFEAIKAAGLSSIGALVEQIPVLSTGAHLVQAASNPYEAKKLEEDMKRRFEPQILRETGIISKDGVDDTKPEWQFLKDKGLSVVPMNKEGIDVNDKQGKKIKVTEDDFKKVSDLRMKLLQDETSTLIKKGAIVWESGKRIKATDLTKDQLKQWLMNKSTKFKKEAIEKVFGVQEKKDEKPKIDTRN